MNRLTLMAIAVILAGGLGVKLASTKSNQAVANPLPSQPVSQALKNSEQQISTPSSARPVAAEPKPNLPSITISTCNGNTGDANFRSTPSMAKSAIAGVIESGQQVYLTGRIVEADGEVWHEAIAPSASRDPGWIAGCFVP